MASTLPSHIPLDILPTACTSAQAHGRHPTLECPSAGVKLAPGNYSVQPYSNQGHIYLSCSTTRTTAFSIDLSNTYLTFTVRPACALLHLSPETD